MERLETNFIKDNWCDLEWSPWINFEDISKLIPASSGFYRVKPINHQYLVYIGQTGNLKRRTTTLKRESNKKAMPFRDPHTGAPCLWAWKDAEDLQFECSFTLSDISQIERKSVEHLLFWRYRLEYGESPLCSFGRFHKNYKISSNSAKKEHGCKLEEGQINPSGRNSQTPLFLNGFYQDNDWMELNWSKPKLFNKSEVKNLGNQPGIYKIFTDSELLYIGETKNFRNRFSDHIKKDWSFLDIYFSISQQGNDIAPHQLKELENDLIGGFYWQTKKSPVFQFKNLKPA